MQSDQQQISGLRIVLTGSRGFIGTRLRQDLLDRGAIVEGWVRPSTPDPRKGERRVDMGSLESISLSIKAFRPDVIIHAASLAVPGRDLSWFPEFYRSTVEPTLNLALSVDPATHLIFLGSCEEYGNAQPPFREDETPLVAFSPYGWAKISAFHGAGLIARQRKLSWNWIRPFLTFGPGQRLNSLIASLVRAAHDRTPLELTAGEQTRDFIYVDDLSRMIQQVVMARHSISGEVLNLCSGIPREVRSVVGLISQLSGFQGFRLGALPYREAEAMEFYGDPSKWKRLFGSLEMTDFEKAIQKTLEGTQ